MCGDLWFSQTGKVIYTACGNAFHSSASRASDMEYAGALALSASQHSGYRVRSLSQSDAVGEIALVEDDNDPCRSAIDPARCFAHVALYGSDFLDRTALFSLEPITVAGQPYLQLGSFVFYSANGRRKFLLSQLYGMQNPAAEHYLSEF